MRKDKKMQNLKEFLKEIILLPTVSGFEGMSAENVSCLQLDVRYDGTPVLLDYKDMKLPPFSITVIRIDS